MVLKDIMCLESPEKNLQPKKPNLLVNCFFVLLHNQTEIDLIPELMALRSIIYIKRLEK